MKFNYFIIREDEIRLQVLLTVRIKTYVFQMITTYTDSIYCRGKKLL